MKLGELINTPLPAAGGRMPTGMRDLDALIGGLPVGHVSTIAAYPCMGTTAFAVSLLRNVAVFGGVPAVYFTNDKSEMDIAQRFVKAGGGRLRVTDAMVSDAGLVEAAQKLERVGFELDDGGLKDESYRQLLSEAPVWIEGDGLLTVEDIIARMEQMKREHDIKVVVVDKLKWIVSTIGGGKHGVMIQLEDAAKRLDVVVLVVAEIKDVVDRNGSYWPQLSDLRDGFGADTFSSMVLLLYRPEYFCIFEDEQGSTVDKADVIVAKNRYGAIGEVRLDFRNHCSFEDCNSKQMYSLPWQVRDRTGR